jgi:hypothetical protein
VAGAFECGNEPSGSIKWGEFLDWLNNCWLFKKDSAPWSSSYDSLNEMYLFNGQD